MEIASLEEIVDFGETHFFQVPEGFVNNGEITLRLAETAEQIELLEELNDKNCLQAGYFKVAEVRRKTKNDEFENMGFKDPKYVVFSAVDIPIVSEKGSVGSKPFCTLEKLDHPKNNLTKGELYLCNAYSSFTLASIARFGNPVEDEPGKADGIVELNVARLEEHRGKLWNERKKIDYGNLSTLRKIITIAPCYDINPPADYLRPDR